MGQDLTGIVKHFAGLKILIPYLDFCCQPELKSVQIALFFAIFLAIQGKHSLHIPRYGHKCPFAGGSLQTPQEKLSEAQDMFDNAKYRFNRALALRVNLTALDSLEFVPHLVNRLRIFR